MTIEFVVEDGTSKTDSTSYVSVADFKQYWENRGTTYTDTDATIQAWLNTATEYIDSSYNFTGEISDEDQALQWPRWGVQKLDGGYYESTDIPKNLKSAVCQLAAIKKNESLYDVGYNIKSESYGPVSKTYSGKDGQKYFPIVDKLLKHLISVGPGLMRVN